MIPLDVLEAVSRDLHDQLLRHSADHRAKALPWCSAGQAGRCSHDDCCARAQAEQRYCRECAEHC